MNSEKIDLIIKTLDKYPGYKFCSNGDIIGKNNKIMKGSYDKDGYKKYKLINKIGVQDFVFGHRLIALAFVENPDNYPVVNHLNGIKDANEAINLEWTTVSKNTKHAYDIGLYSDEAKEKIYRGVPVTRILNNKKYSFKSFKEASEITGLTEFKIRKFCRDNNNKEWVSDPVKHRKSHKNKKAYNRKSKHVGRNEY